MSARALRTQIVHRKVAEIISGADTGARPDGGEVTAGWAMGRFYAPGTAAFTEDFEIKEWGGKNYSAGGGTFRTDWRDHTDDGNEYIRVIAGTLTVHLGEEDGSGDVRRFESITVAAGESIALPAGLHRKFDGTDDVLAVTVRRGTRTA